MEPVVYAIKNLNDMKMYVGSTVNKSVRWQTHRTLLRHGKHENGFLQAAWDRDGEPAFVFAVLEVIDVPGQLAERETWWLNHLTPYGVYGYNILRTAHDGTRGYKFPDEVRQKMSLMRKGVPKSPRSKEHCENIRKAKLGKPHPVTWAIPPKSNETRAKLSASHIGRHVGEANEKAKLNDDAVRDIRRRLVDGESGFSIAKFYGVHRQAIYRIRDRITWKHVKE
jgi:group I intron endonuclease